MADRFEKVAFDAKLLQGKAHDLTVRAERMDIPGRMVTSVFINWLACQDAQKARDILTLMEMWLDDRAVFKFEVVDQIKATPIKRRRRRGTPDEKA